MSAIFTIDQATLPAGTADRSRQDIIPGGAPVQFAAVYPPPNHTTYKWEFLSQPSGVTLSFSDPTIDNPTVDFGMNYGGFLIRLTVDAGTATEDVSVRAVYLKWPVSSKAIPALTETNQDNSQLPNTGYRGWEEKIIDYLWWVESNIGGGASGVTPAGYIYVDEHNGDDILGTGEINNPFATLAHAATTVPNPTNPVEFYTPTHFVLNPGVYPGNVNLPGKKAVYIIEAPGVAVINGDITWDVDPDWWALYGIPAQNFAALSMYGNIGADRYTQEPPALMHRGTLITRNSNPGGGNPMVDAKYLHARGVSWTHGGIWNQASGTSTPAGATGSLIAYFDYCDIDVTGPAQGIFGEREQITGVDFLPNFVHVYADNSRLRALYGSMRLGAIHNTYINGTIDCNHDWNANPISGFIEGSDPGFQKCFVRNLTAGHDGVDPAAPTARSLWFDSFTWDEANSGGAPVFTNMHTDSPGSRGYNFSERDIGIDVDASAFVGNLGPPNALPILSNVLARIDALALGGGPVGLGRIYIDPVHGIDLPGNGTISNPFQTLGYACASVPPTGVAADFLTPFEFIMAPGQDLSAGPIIIPPRCKVTISGRDTFIQQLLMWNIDPSWWAVCGLDPTVDPPELFIDGRESSTQASPFWLAPPRDMTKPSFLLGAGISARNINPGGAGGMWKGRHRLHISGASVTAILNLASGGAPLPSDATGDMILRLNKAFIGGLPPSPLGEGTIASEKEPLIPVEMNFIHIVQAFESYIGGIHANTLIGEIQECSVRTVDLSFDATGGIIPDGYVGCTNTARDERPNFIDCRFYEKAYLFGWDGLTGPAEPYGPSFDAVSYRSLLEAEKLGAIFAISNLLVNTEVAVDEAPSRVVAGCSLGAAHDLVAGGHISPATAYPIPWQIPGVGILDGDFQLVAGTAPVVILRGGRYRVTFKGSFQNSQLLFFNTVGVAVWYNGIQNVASASFTTLEGPGLGVPSNGSIAAVGLDVPLKAGDQFEFRCWIDSTFFGISPIDLLPSSFMGVERVE